MGLSCTKPQKIKHGRKRGKHSVVPVWSFEKVSSFGIVDYSNQHKGANGCTNGNSYRHIRGDNKRPTSYSDNHVSNDDMSNQFLEEPLFIFGNVSSRLHFDKHGSSDLLSCSSSTVPRFYLDNSQDSILTMESQIMTTDSINSTHSAPANNSIDSGDAIGSQEMSMAITNAGGYNSKTNGEPRSQTKLHHNFIHRQSSVSEDSEEKMKLLMDKYVYKKT